MGGHGYHGCYMVTIKCMNPLCGTSLPYGKYDTLSMSMEEAEERAVKVWNTRANE